MGVVRGLLRFLRPRLGTGVGPRGPPHSHRTLSVPPAKKGGGPPRTNRALRATHSRRDADRLVFDGRLSVNGAVVANPHKRLKPGDVVRLDGGAPVPWEEEDLIREVGPQRYVKLHKPRDVECTTDRRVAGNIADYFESIGGNEAAAMSAAVVADDGSDDSDSSRSSFTPRGRRVYPVGRLDRDSTGLILLTSDGSIVNPLLRAEEGKAKEYVVTTDPSAAAADMRELERGVVITTVARRDGGLAEVTARTKPCTVERMNAVTTGELPNALRFVLEEGRNRQIRRMCAALDLEVTSLHRVAFAGVTLEGCEAPGSWADLTEEEEIMIGARMKPKRVRSPEEVERRKAKKIAKKERTRAERMGGDSG